MRVGWDEIQRSKVGAAGSDPGWSVLGGRDEFRTTAPCNFDLASMTLAAGLVGAALGSGHLPIVVQPWAM